MLGRDSHSAVGPALTDLVHQGERDFPREANRTQGGELKGQQPLGRCIIELVERRQDLVEVAVRPGFGNR